MSSTSQNSPVQDSWDKMSEQLQTQCAAQAEDFQQLMERVGHELAVYCQQRPRVVAVGLLALGFLVGWKLKP